MEKLYSIQDAARQLGGISKWTIYSWLSKGKIRRTKVGSRTMIQESELLRMVRTGGKTSKSQRVTSARLTAKKQGKESQAVTNPTQFRRVVTEVRGR